MIIPYQSWYNINIEKFLQQIISKFLQHTIEYYDKNAGVVIFLVYTHLLCIPYYNQQHILLYLRRDKYENT